MKITNLSPQKKRKDRWNLFLDGEFYCGMDEGAVARLGLKIGQEVDEDFLAKMENEETSAKAWNALLFFLKSRERSEKEVINKLKSKEFSDNVIAQTLEKAKDLNLIDDQRFAEMWIRERAKFNPKGKRALQMELRQKGIADEILKQVLAENIDTETEESLAHQAFEKKSRVWTDMADRKQREKMTRYLAGRGFSWNTIEKLIKTK
ncbi:RecX family transcriptional regulator [Candidatus Microgenomates bacterium]|nr:RecX family transcriptional regulator [Candidatus Microgenomates bacterium]